MQLRTTSPVASKSLRKRTHDSGTSLALTVQIERPPFKHLVRGSSPRSHLWWTRPSPRTPRRRTRSASTDHFSADEMTSMHCAGSRPAQARRAGVPRRRVAGAKVPPQLQSSFPGPMTRHRVTSPVEITAGLYPLTSDDTCFLLACDFDGPGSLLRCARVPSTQRDPRASQPRWSARGPGDGSHIWIFFDDRVAASSARRIGAHLIREAMAARAELDLASYDRLFPAQDFLARKGFGNLIALPLQGECRRKGTTVLLDPATLEPYEDQWAFLATVQRLSSTVAVELAELLR